MNTHGATVQMIEGGRITIPSEIRKVENLEEGDFVKITITPIRSGSDWIVKKRDALKNMNKQRG